MLDTAFRPHDTAGEGIVMSGCMSRVGSSFLFLGSVVSCFCQTPATDPRSPDAAIYEAFFREVAQLKSLSGDTVSATMAGGRVIQLTVPKLQNVIGLTDSEVDALTAAAVDSVRQIGLLDNAARPLILDVRLQQLESGKLSASTAQRLSAFESNRRQIVLTHVQEIRAAFGESRFPVLDEYVMRPGRNPRDLQPYGTLPAAR